MYCLTGYPEWVIGNAVETKKGLSKIFSRRLWLNSEPGVTVDMFRVADIKKEWPEVRIVEGSLPIISDGLFSLVIMIYGKLIMNNIINVGNNGLAAFWN